MAWHMDNTTFGNPNHGMSQTQSGQFMRGPGSVGIGVYRTTDPTGPLPVSLSWEMSGPVFQEFREAWEDASRLSFGGNWFTLDLPTGLVMLSGGTGQYIDTPVFFRLDISNKSDNQLGFYDSRYDAVTPRGDLAPRRVDGRWVRNLLYTLSSDRLTFAMTDLGDFPGSPASVSMFFPATDETAVLGWNAGSTDYRITGLAAQAPNMSALLTAGQDGDMFEVVMTVRLQTWQTVNAHFTAPFAANLLSDDRWAMTGELEIDVTQQLTQGPP